MAYQSNATASRSRDREQTVNTGGCLLVYITEIHFRSRVRSLMGWTFVIIEECGNVNSTEIK